MLFYHNKKCPVDDNQMLGRGLSQKKSKTVNVNKEPGLFRNDSRSRKKNV